jgi:hypothetical protein
MVNVRYLVDDVEAAVRFYTTPLASRWFDARTQGVHDAQRCPTVVRGESTEITGYDNDAYLTGQRVSVKRPKDLFFDEVSVTFAYLGDLTTPSITNRYHRLDEVNYRHLLASKKATSWLASSMPSGMSSTHAPAPVQASASQCLERRRPLRA